MTDPLSRIRDVAMLLPEVTETDGGFAVADAPFVQVADGAASARILTGAPTEWTETALTGDVDWQLVEDRIAHGWELAAPGRLLEAGGR